MFAWNTGATVISLAQQVPTSLRSKNHVLRDGACKPPQDPLQTPSPPVRLLPPSVFCLSLNACNTRMVAPLFKAIVTVRDEQVGGAEDKLRHHCPPCLFCRPAENGAGARESNRSRCEWHSPMIYCLRASTPFPSDQPQHARERRCSGGSLLFVSGLGSSGVEQIYRRNVFVGYKRKC